MTRALAIGLAAIGLLAPATATAAGPGEAAHGMRDCLRAHGWRAHITDQGHGVQARSPYRRNRTPHRGYYSVAFYTSYPEEPDYPALDLPPTWSTWGLTRTDYLTARRCQRGAAR